jgi:hypothetical protein
MRRPNSSMFIVVLFGLFSTVLLLASVSTHTSAYSHIAGSTPTAYVYLPVVARQPTPTPSPSKTT